MSMETKVSYGFGYIISTPEIEKLGQKEYTQLINSPWYHVIDGWSASHDAFFGIKLFDMEEGSYRRITLNDKMDYQELVLMLEDYREIFKETPTPADYYILYFVY